MEDTSPSSPSLPSAPSVEASSPSAALKLPIVQALNTTRTTQGSTYYFDRSDDRALEYLHDAATLGASRIQRRRGRGSPGDGLLLGAYKEKYQGHTIELRHRSHRLIGLRVAREQRKEQEAIEAGRARVAAIMAGRQTMAQQRLHSTQSYSGSSKFNLLHHYDPAPRGTKPAEPGDLCEHLRTGMLLTRSSSAKEVGELTRTADTKTTLEWRCDLRGADREVQELDAQAVRLRPSHTPSPSPSLATDTLTRLRAVKVMEEERRLGHGPPIPQEAQAEDLRGRTLLEKSKAAAVDRYFNHRLYLRLPVRC